MWNKFWKAYLLLMTLTLVIFLPRVIQKPQFTNITGEIIHIITLIGLYGYCFKRKIGTSKIWKIVFWVSVLAEIELNVLPSLSHSLDRVSNVGFVLGYAFGFVIPFLIYIVIYLYAFKSPEIWGKS